MWIYFLKLNSGSALKTLESLFIHADISSDASGRTFAGVVSRRGYPDSVVAGSFGGHASTRNSGERRGSPQTSPKYGGEEVPTGG